MPFRTRSRSPFRTKSKKQNKNLNVSFGEDKVKEVERYPEEDHGDIWYCKEEMDTYQKRDSFTESMKMECSQDAWLHGQRHVRKIATKCRQQLDQADGYWDAKMTLELSKISVTSSKGHREEARKKAGTVYKEVYDCDVAYTSKNGLSRTRSLSPMSIRGRSAAVNKIAPPSFRRWESQDSKIRSLSPSCRKVSSFMKKVLPPPPPFLKNTSWGGSPIQTTSSAGTTPTENTTQPKRLSLLDGSSSEFEQPNLANSFGAVMPPIPSESGSAFPLPVMRRVHTDC